MIQLSVLDRLVSNSAIDQDSRPGGPIASTSRLAPSSRNPVVTRADFDRYRLSVKEHLQWLLNTRRTSERIPKELEAVSCSVYCYGLPSFSATDLDLGHNQSHREKLAREIRQTIQTFEPRIAITAVEVLGEAIPGQELRFRISGSLKMKPRNRPVHFDTVLDVVNQEYKVEIPGASGG